MAIPRIAPIHFQMILFALLFIIIACKEILPEKKYLFVLLFALFCYQLSFASQSWIQSQCFNCLFVTNQAVHEEDASSKNTSLPKLAEYSEPYDNISANYIETTICESNVLETQSPCQSSDANEESVATYADTEDNIQISEHLVKSCKPFQMSPKSVELLSNVPLSEKRSSFKTKEESSMVEVSGIKKFRPIRSVTFREKTILTNFDDHRSESLKCYLKPNINNGRQYKVRHWSEKDSEYKPHPRSSSTSTEGSEDAFECCELPNQLTDYEEDKKDLNKSYSFPLRQKRQSRWIESPDKWDNEFKIPAMPIWDYSSTLNPEEKRRKSLSTDALDREMKSIQSKIKGIKEDFCQSLELTRETLHADSVGKNPTKPLTSFNKLKQGIVNRFNKSKRADASKPISENKSFFKELFASKENVNQTSAKKLSTKREGRVCTKFSPQSIHNYNNNPTYISYSQIDL